MKRRAFCIAVGAASAIAASPIRAQSARPMRLAWVSVERGNMPSPYLDAFLNGMREVGYTKDKDFVLRPWWGEGSVQRVEAMAGDIVRERPDVIVSQGGLALLPLVRASVKTPIVFTYSGDPVEAKLVDSFARPGGTMTGISYFTLEIVGKRLEVLKDILPGIKRIAFIANPQHAGEQKEFAAAQVAAAKLGMTVRYFPVRSSDDVEKALGDIARNRDEAIVVFADAFTLSFASRIAAFSVENRIPAVDGWAPFAREGNLLVYGPNLEDCYRRLAGYVDRIHKGARPGDLPIELPTKVELVVNMKTAKALGLTIPPAVLARTDELIS